MRFLVGTSGFSYPEWKGSFYPADLAAKDMLRYYAERLGAVEINNTFYRMPKSAVLAGWAEQVPEGFRFVIKASRRITHFAKLVDTGETLTYLWRAMDHLGAHRGPALFQLPPTLRADPAVLQAFLEILPAGQRVVFEFRHASWESDEIRDLLAGRGVAVCVNDDEDHPERPAVTATADFGYLRLRRPDYDDPTLAGWVETIRAQPWQDVFVFFKHEDAGAGPALAQRFRAMVDGAN